MTWALSQFQPDRLRAAREARGLSGSTLTDLVGLRHRSSITHYEKNRHEPSVETLRAISEKLRVPIQHFFRPMRHKREGLLFWRSQAPATQAERLRATRRYEWLMEIVDYLGGYIALPPAEFPKFDVPADPRELTDSVIERYAQECRRFWSLGDGPISNVVLLMENHGAGIVRCPLQSESLDAFSHWNEDQNRPYIILASDKGSAARLVIDAGHELGHMLLHRLVPEKDFNKGEIHKLMEQQAMRFAGAFLLPASTFAADLYSQSLEAFVSLKSKWRVAVQAMIVRATQLGLISEDDAKGLWIRLVRRGWKRKEPLDDTLPAEEPRLIRRCFETLIADGFDAQGMATALAIPLEDIESVCGLPPGFLSFAGNDQPLRFRLTQ